MRDSNICIYLFHATAVVGRLIGKGGGGWAVEMKPELACVMFDFFKPLEVGVRVSCWRQCGESTWTLSSEHSSISKESRNMNASFNSFLGTQFSWEQGRPEFRINALSFANLYQEIDEPESI